VPVALLPLDDLLFITRQYINSEVPLADLARLLKREGMSRLEDTIPKAEGETIAPKKTLRTRLHSHRYQVLATDARRDLAALSVRRYRPGYTLGIHAH